MKDYVKIGGGAKSLKTSQKFLTGLVWFISTARNAIVVLICACAASALMSLGQLPFMLTGMYFNLACFTSVYLLISASISRILLISYVNSMFACF